MTTVVACFAATAGIVIAASGSATLSPANADPGSADAGGSDCRTLSPAKVVSFDDGGRDYVFDTPVGEVDIPEPPAGFSPASATPALRSRYGFPPKPTDPGQVPEWAHAMASYKQTSTPTLCWNDAPPPPVFGPQDLEVSDNPPGADTSANAIGTSNNWAGYIAEPATGNSFISAVGDYYQPIRNSSPCTNAHQSEWTGLGGYKDRADGTRGLIQNGTAYGPTGSPYAWWEYVGQDANGNPIGVAEQKFSNMDIAAGDHIYSYTGWDPSTNMATFYVEDETSGTAGSHMPVLNSKWYDGRDAEWIVERPTSAAGSLWPLQDFYRISWHSVQAQNSKNDWYYLADLHEKINVTMQNSPADILATPSDIGGTNGGVFQSLYQFCV